MRTGNILFSAVHFFVVIFFFSIGAFFLALPHAPHVRAFILEILTQKTHLFTLISFASFVVGILLTVGFYSMYRNSYLQVYMDKNSAVIEPSLVRQYVERYWEELFPDQDLLADVQIHADQKIELITEMPEFPADEQMVLLQKIERELGSLMAKNLGYDKEFLVNIVLKPSRELAQKS